MSIDVSIIIVGTNEREFVYKCLKSIADSVTRYNVETILVDNASCDGTSDMVRKDFPGIILIRNEKKQRYIHANHAATRIAKGRYVLLINSDIELQPDTLQLMIGFMDGHPDAAASSCKLTFDDGTLQLNCRRFPTPLTYFARLPHFFRWIKIGKRFASNDIVKRYLMLDYDHKELRQVDWLVSAFFLLRKEAIDDIGMLDDKMVPPFYLEDVDWCFRAHRKGWKVYYVPQTYAVHYYKRGSVKKFNRLSIVHFLNILIFYKKHAWPMLLRKHRKVKP